MDCRQQNIERLNRLSTLYNIIILDNTGFWKKNGTNLEKFGQIWTNLDRYRQIWTNLDKYGQIWTNLDISELIQIN